MIDINWTELVALAVLAVIMFGPEKLPGFARQAARIIAYLSKIGNDARGQLRAELGPEFDDLRLSDLNPRNFVARHILSADEKDDLLAIREEFREAGHMAANASSSAQAAMSAPLTETGPEPVAPVPARRTPFDPEAT